MSTYPPLAVQAYEQLLAYAMRHPEEVGGVKAAGLHIQRSPNDVCNRSNMEGHITASALVLAPCARGIPHALLVHHKSLQRWLTPGGHLELGGDVPGGDNHHRRAPAYRAISSFAPDQTLWDAAMREVIEETGVQDVVPQPLRAHSTAKGRATNAHLPHGLADVFDIDTHAIPKNAAKGEGAHVHHDFMFLAQAPSLASLKPQLAEINGARWMPAVQLTSMCTPRMDRVLRKLHLLDLA